MLKQKSAEDWVQAATRRLARQGIASVRVEPLAADLGVTKGSFYWHFADLNALRAAMLNTWEARATTEIIERIDRHDGDAASRLKRLGEIVFGGAGDLERQVRAWAAQDETAAVVQDRVDGRRIAYVERLFVATGLGPEVARTRAQFMYQALVGQFTLGKRRGRGSEAIGDIVDLLVANPAKVARRRSTG